MALSTRELLLVLRARDEASRVLRGIGTGFNDLDAAAMQAARNQQTAGSALVGLGVGMAAAGVAALDWFAGTVQSAVEFERQVAKIATQTDNVKASQKELGDITMRVARQVAVPLEELNQGLYDIFSSLDVTVPESEKLLEAFAKEAVAGQVSIQDASRATIGIMNAFHIPVKDVNKVLDVQFQLVRKGVGSFSDFAQAIGKVTPSATRAGQSIETMAGMLAYMTRNGMTAQQASASAGRALDAFSNPKVVGRLEKMGIHIKNASGEFNDMGTVMTELQQKLGKLTDPQRSAALKDLFLGAGGTIQARRFFDLVTKDAAAAQQFVGLVGEMKDAAGAFTESYDIMAGTAASKSQVLQNNWEALKIEVGQALMPVLGVLIKVLQEVLGWWNSLSDGTKEVIVWVTAGAAALAVIVGVLIAAAGVIMMVGGAAAALGISVGALIGIGAAVVAAIAAIIAIGWLLIANWDKVKSFLTTVWDGIVTAWNAVYEWVKARFGDRLSKLWNDIKDSVVSAFTTVRDWVVNIWQDIVNWTSTLWGKLQPIIQPTIEWIIGIWGNVKDALLAVLDILMGALEFLWNTIKAVFTGLWTAISGVLEGVWNIIKGFVDLVIGIFTGDWALMWEGLVSIFTGIWDIIKGIFVGAWEIISGVVVAAWEFIKSIIEPAWELIKNLFQIGAETLMAVWNWLWTTIQNLLRPIIDGIVGAAKWLWDQIVGIWNSLKNSTMELANWIGQRLRDIGQFFRDLPGNILNALGNLGSWLVQAGRDLVQGLINGIGDMAGWVKDKLMGLAQSAWNAVKDFFGFGSPSRLMRQGGRWVGQGLALGILDMVGEVEAAAAELGAAGAADIDPFGSGTTPGFGGASPGVGADGTTPMSPGGGSGGQVVQYVIVHTNEIDPRKNSADLGWELAHGNAGMGAGK